jgi:two-component system, NarL family, invasion response regulator UvrY
MSYKVLIADDHSMIRKGLKLYLQLSLHVQHIKEVSSCSELLKELQANSYSHLILDIILSDGNVLEILDNIITLYPALKIMMFSNQPKEVYGEVVKKFNVFYYLSKTEDEENTIAFLKSFLQGLADKRTASSTNNINPFSQLTARELEVLHYILRGQGTKEIGDILNLRMNTISTLKKRIFEKVNVDNNKELMDLATLYKINY